MRKHIGVLAAGVLALGLTAPMTAVADPPAGGLTVDAPSIATETERGQIDVMGLWSHPDDDAGFTTPCGVWQDLYDVNCGIIMITRGEGGSNSVGNEAGPDLGLRRENEDRASHVRMGTVDVFNIDRADFYYNTSAPLTAQVWDEEETLRRIVRVIRETRPSVLVGWPPSFKFGHGNHQYAGRLVWEAAEAAADPDRFPEQLTGLGAVDTWQVKKILDGHYAGWNAYDGTGDTLGEDCMVGFEAADDNPFTVVGTWSGYESPYTWAEGNTAGIEAGTPKTWAQVGTEGGRAHPTQARVMQKDPVDPTCIKYGVIHSEVPMQPNSSSLNGDDGALLGAAIADPGGFPLGTLFSVEADDYFVAAGEAFTVDVAITVPEGEAPAGELAVQAPAGWTVSDPVAVEAGATVSAQFTVTPAADAADQRYRLSATFSGDDVTGYNDTRVEVVPGVEGRFERSHTSAEYDEWTETHGVYEFGRSEAIADMGAGESRTLNVEVTNRTSDTESGEVELTTEHGGFAIEDATLPFGPLGPGESQMVEFTLTHTDPSALGENVEFIATTTALSGTSTEALNMYLVPTTVIPQLESAPVIDGVADDVYSADAISIGQRWEGDDCDPDGEDCGEGSEAKLGWYDDALYAQMTVIDDRASAGATFDRCFGHWLVDSVELLVDPRGDSSDTSTTFKLGIFPFTDDPAGENGNGPDGPCWSRDADNHQGFSTGPLADTVIGAPNAEGVEVAVTGERDADGNWVQGHYTVEVKVPMDVLPAAVGPTNSAPTGLLETNEVDPTYMGLNITPYDSDRDDFIGETRLAWSAFGSQQSEPYRWGHAYLEGYEHPTGRSTEAPEPIIPDTALMGVESPQTIYQSAVRGGTISGVQPSDALTITDVEITEDEVVISYEAEAAGTLRGFLWAGDPTFVPVWTSSCEGDTDGFDACSESDGQAPPWAPDMGGRLQGDGQAEVAVGSGELRIAITEGGYEALAEDGIVLASFAESGTENGDGVNAWAFPVVEGEVPTPEPSEPSPTVSPEPTPTTTPTEPAVRPGPPSTGV